MSTPSSVSGGDGDMLSSGKEDKKTDNPSLQSKSASDASLPPTKFDNLNSSLDIKENMMCTDDEIDDFLLAENAEEEKSSTNDLEQVTGSQESSESEELYLVLSDEGETDNPTDAERNCDEGNSNVNKSQVSVKEQSENIDSSQKSKDQVPFEETLTYDLHVSENHNNSECSTDSSDLLKMTTEEEMICPPVNDNILDEDDFKTKQQAAGVNSAHSSGGSASEDTKKSLKEQSVKSKVVETPTEVCKELRGGGRLKDKNRVESMEESSNSNSSGSNTEPESRSVSEASLNKTQDTTDSRVSSPSTGQQQPTSEKSSATKDKSVTETSDVAKHVAMDISSTLPSGLFKDDSLEEFSLSPKDCQSLKGDEKSAGVEANGLNEAEQGLSIEDIIDNLSSPIEEDACSMVEENAASKSETEVKEPSSSDDRRASIKRAPDPDSLSNDKVEVKKVKLDIVFGDKTADSENSDETKNVTSTISVDERESANVNGEVTKMEVCCDDDIDIIEEKPPEKKGENADEKVVGHPDTEEKEMPPHVEEKLEVKAEVKVNGIATDHSDEDADEETIVITSENVDELVIKRVSDMFYEDHINTIVTMMKKIETLERALEKSRKRISYYQNMLGNLSSEHRRQLAKFGFLPKVHTRTVGVNVRILQEHELQSTNRLGMVKGGLVPAATSSAPPAQSTPVLTNTTMQLTPQPTAKKTVFPRASTPAGLTPGPRMPSPNVTVSQITVSPAGTGNDDKIRAPSSLQIFPTPGNQGVASPAMINRPRPQPSILRRQPVSKSPVNVASAGPLMVVQSPSSSASCATSSSSSSINVIDLTEDGDSSLTTTTAGTSQSSAMLVSPSVTRGPSSNLVPMPLVGSVNSVVQLVPSGPHVGSSISGNSAIRVGRPPTVLPNSACLSQGPRVAYVLQQNPGTLVMPRMDGQVSQIGSLQPHQSPFVTSSGQHVPTIFVRMNAPPSNTAPVASSNVVSGTKSAVSQSIAPARTLPSGNPSSSTMLISCSVAKHPAPLPPAQAYPENKTWKSLPPKPALKISKVLNGIVLLWSMSLYNSHAEIASYQLFAYQESNQPVTSSLWKKVGDVKALPLPMACTLTQFVEGHKYHFAVRAVDVHGRIGPFSDPSSIVLLPRSEQNTATK